MHKLKRWLFIKVIQSRAKDSITKEYQSTGRVMGTLRRRIDALIMRNLMAPGGRKEYSPAVGEESEMGSITWSFTDCVSREVTALTESTPMLSEARIILMKSNLTGEMQSKCVRLSDQFCLTLHDSRVESVKEGFALNADERENQSFGWEWFLVDSAEHATKLQETGELELTFANPKDQIGIIGCKFLTDISFRFSSHEYSMNRSNENMINESGAPFDAQYRITVKAGSYVRWPVLLDGVVQMPSVLTPQ